MTPKVPNTENPGLFDVFSVFLHWLPQQVSSVNCLIFRFFFRRIDLAEIILCWIIKSGISFTKFLSSCLLTKICVLLFFTGLAGGFWGNHVLHNGVVEFEIATQNIVGIVRHIQEMSRKYNEVLQKDIEQNMNKLYDGPFQRDIRESPSSHLEIMDNSDFIFFNISEGLKAMDEIRFTVSDPNNRIDLRYLPFWASTVERYRWPITMALQSKIQLIFHTCICIIL